MNDEDKKRFARYRPGYIELSPTQEKEPINETANKEYIKNSKKVKDTLGFVEKIEIDSNDLINQIISEMEHKNKL